ncbi:hypothetical protein AAFF_G00413870 [Aldrovandia affinis]|uniref:Uncharacterized protein n=1 Tax=Aldrovandia affinis TaxID=143900 RepID=A0AAD7SB95_9TELE|nr:hypothetical protein AAFF_G00413870 [Aldrovandia affinis]
MGSRVGRLRCTVRKNKVCDKPHSDKPLEHKSQTVPSSAELTRGIERSDFARDRPVYKRCHLATAPPAARRGRFSFGFKPRENAEEVGGEGSRSVSLSPGRGDAAARFLFD